MRSNHQGRPLIIIGMHRSGTSLLAGILERCGIFMGARKDENNEAIFFQKINEWIFRQANASWDNPRNFKFIDSHFRDYCKRVIASHLGGFQRIKYLGLKRALRYRDIREIDFPWGWKDPRNTYTVELWKEIFPGARVLHIFRNPVDVAASLKRREERLRKGFDMNLKKWIKERILFGRTYPNWSVRVQDIYEGINLWREYLEQAFSLNKEFGQNLMHIRYESFLEAPEIILKKILDFAGLKLGDETISNSVRGIDGSRRFAFVNDQELIEVYRDIRDMEMVKKLGYEGIIG